MPLIPYGNYYPAEIQRRAVLKVPGPTLVELLKHKEGEFLSFHGMPDDTKFISAGFDAEKGVVILVLESSKFNRVFSGQAVEEIAISAEVLHHPSRPT